MIGRAHEQRVLKYRSASGKRPDNLAGRENYSETTSRGPVARMGAASIFSAAMRLTIRLKAPRSINCSQCSSLANFPVNVSCRGGGAFSRISWHFRFEMAVWVGRHLCQSSFRQNVSGIIPTTLKGEPSWKVGLNRHCRAVSSAVSASDGCPRRTATSSTLPSSSIRTSARTVCG